MLHHAPTIPRSAFEKQTGWQFKPEGACKGDVCVPLTDPPGDTLELESIGAALGMPLVSAPEHNLWALGPESVGSKALLTAQAAPLSLPDLNGTPFELSSLLGKKVVIYAWAPY